MQLTDEQKQNVASWIANGAKLSEVQQRLADEFGIRLTYMEARFLVDDLSLVPKETVTAAPAKKPEPAETPKGAVGGDTEEAFEEEAEIPGELPEESATKLGKVSVTVDQITRPGSLVSGSATFSDGVVAEWYLDQMGRFGLVPPKPGYRPSSSDLAEFRVALERELARMGL